jgi:hypothetical protein
VPPFRFNPKLDKEAQGKASFVQIKARFNSERDNFEFVSLLGVPTDSPPNYLKAGKKDKLSVAKTKLAAQKARKRSSSSVPDNNAAPNPRVLPTSLSLSPSPREPRLNPRVWGSSHHSTSGSRRFLISSSTRFREMVKKKAIAACPSLSSQHIIRFMGLV